MQRYTQLKDKGNNLFKQNKFKQSISLFQQSIDLINSQQKKQNLNNLTQLGKLYVILNINAAFAAIQLKLSEYYIQAIQYCNIALKIDPKNQKGLYRRGLANQELAQLLQSTSKETSQQLLNYYKKAKNDFQDVLVIDKNNALAQKYYQQSMKNIYRVTTLTQGQVDLSSKTQTKSQVKKVEIKKQVKQGPPKRTGDMTTILKEYHVQQITSIARQKVENQYLSNQLPKTRAQLQKALRQINKSQQITLKFIYRFDEEYLKKILPTFDMLFQMVNIVIKLGQGEQAKRSLNVIKNQKAFDLLWKSYSSKQKILFKEKWVGLGLPQEEIK